MSESLSKTMSKEAAESLSKKIISETTSDLGSGVLKNSTEVLGSKAAKTAAEDALKMSSQFAKDALTTVAYQLKTAAKTIIEKTGSILKTIGGKAFNLAKKYPKLALLGLTAAGIAIYAAAKGITFEQACIFLGKQLAKDVAEMAKALNKTACEVTGVCPSDIIDNFLTYLKYGGIVIGVILLLYLIYYIFKVKKVIFN